MATGTARGKINAEAEFPIGLEDIAIEEEATILRDLCSDPINVRAEQVAPIPTGKAK
jgi:hypothetical protein